MGYDNTNSGALFPNNNRQKDTHPHYKGELNVEGVEYWISAWSNISKQGKKYLSMNITPKTNTGYTKKELPKDDFLDEEVPLAEKKDAEPVEGLPGAGTDDLIEDDVPF